MDVIGCPTMDKWHEPGSSLTLIPGNEDPAAATNKPWPPMMARLYGHSHGPCGTPGIFWLGAQPIRDYITMWHYLSLAEPIARMILAHQCLYSNATRDKILTSTVYWCMTSNLNASWNLVLNEQHPFMCGFCCLKYMYFIKYQGGLIIIIKIRIIWLLCKS